ncbi:hypothetical protein [Paraburkholderia piptadeniae]|uniref:hypothetical protein n=1 Tax=Paraburkholderia piptadeniae TaxID=1701573 RepID=UPI00117D63DA|nr:hypothetical protein [Paraburkholderia piptadeniae]
MDMISSAFNRASTGTSDVHVPTTHRYIGTGHWRRLQAAQPVLAWLTGSVLERLASSMRSSPPPPQRHSLREPYADPDRHRSSSNFATIGKQNR